MHSCRLCRMGAQSGGAGEGKGEAFEGACPYFGRIYERTAGESGTGFPKVWEEELEKCLGPLPLREDERKAMSELAKNLRFREENGQAGRVGQVEVFLEGRLRQAEETLENRSKMIHSVSILTGLLLAIMLL